MSVKSIIFTIILLSATGYSFLVYTTGTASKKGKLDNPQAIRGQLLYQENNCVACHQVYGLGGFMGPDLTNVISKPGKGELYVRAMLKYGSARMPAFDLGDEDIAAITAYLQCVDQSGRFPIPRPESTYWGDIVIEH